MSFKIVVDSCCELPEEYLQDPRFEIVPLGLEVGDYRIQDDESFDQAEFLKKVAESPQCIGKNTVRSRFMSSIPNPPAAVRRRS